MPDTGRTAKQILGLVSLALVPFGVFIYIYSTQILSDIGRFPDEMVEVMASPVSSLGIIRWVGAIMAVGGMVFMIVYLLDYIKNPDVYAENYSRKAAIFGTIAGIFWVLAVTLFGYLPAVSTLAEFSIPEGNIPSEQVPALATEYEIAVFQLATTGGAVVLGLVWWLISVLSWIESPMSAAEILVLDGQPYCGSCGSRLSSEEQNSCPDCGTKLR